MPPSTLPRRLNLGDLAILVGVIAVFLTLARGSWKDPPPSKMTGVRIYRSIPNSGLYSPSPRPDLITEIAGEALLLATLLVVMLRLRWPRPRWGRMMRQPGWVAALAAVPALFAGCMVDQIQSRVELPETRIYVPQAAIRLTIFPSESVIMVGLAVLIAWLVLWGTGACRPERSAIDRLGRVVGMGWIALPLVRLGYGIVRVAWS